MNCKEIRQLINAYADSELDLTRSLEIERHLGDCPGCAASYEGLRALRSAVSRVYKSPPASLQRRVTSAVRKAGRNEAATRLFAWRRIAIATSAAVVLVVSWNLVRLSGRPSPDEVLARDVVSSHVRSLMSNHLTDVLSSDQHTVKPWFAGKLDFSPLVRDLASEGFLLIGGRLDYVDNRPVAAVVYQRRQHYINLFVWPSSGGRDVENESSRQGYNLIYWTRAGMNHWIISDLNKEELEELKLLIQNRTSSTGSS
jgi:anti-sigma factor RsiW